MNKKSIKKASFYINTPMNRRTNTDKEITLAAHDAFRFHTTLPNYKATPLIQLPLLAKKYNIGNLYIKDESYRFDLTAFKVLGASYAIHILLEEKPSISTFCTATDGNHGRAVAWAAKLFDKKAVVIVPRDTTPLRIHAIEQEGATVIQVDGTYDYACQFAAHISIENNWELVQDMAWKGYETIPAHIMAGYTTLFREITAELASLSSSIDIVFLQAGVGSFAGAGINYYLDMYGENRPKIIIVEPIEADAILTSLQNGKIKTSNGNSETIMAGLNCGTPSLGAWNLLKNGIDASISIEDYYTEKAIRELYYPTGSDPRIYAGESGAAGLAGFIAIMNDPKLRHLQEILTITSSSSILFINTEGITDYNSFQQIIRKNDGGTPF